MSDLRLKVKTRKELISIIKKYRKGRKIYLMVDAKIMASEDTYYNDYNSVPVTFKYLMKTLTEKVGLFWSLDDKEKHEGTFVKIMVSELCMFIG